MELATIAIGILRRELPNRMIYMQNECIYKILMDKKIGLEIKSQALYLLKIF